MSKKKEYSEKYVTDILKKNPDIKLNEGSKTIEIAYGFNKLGNSTWGKIDYLEKVHGWTRSFLQQAPKKKRKDKRREKMMEDYV